MEVSTEQEINQIEVGKPHVVILGAGASYAAFPNGDKNGKKLPLMNNFVETLGIEELIERAKIKTTSNNFEDIYSEIHKNPELEPLRKELEKEVYNYFQDIELPDEPTIYDHLVLSLRNKDFIATFNWDPFLVQAIRRNGKRFKLPRVLFLHGNVEVGYCESGHMMGNNGDLCHECDQPLTPTSLLYPVSEKNYHLDKFISRQWATLEDLLKHAFMVTIFGYGAPVSDTRAVELLKKAWGSTDSRNMEEFEIIDVRDEDDLTSTWSPFIHSHHYRVEDSFYNSWIANHPRRTGEAYLNQFMNAMFIDNNPLPKDADFQQLWEWFDKLQAVEDEKEHRILLPTNDAVCNNEQKDMIFLFKIDPQYIKKVILGCRMKESTKKYIYEKLSGYEIQILEAEPHPAHYKLKFENHMLNGSKKANVVYNLGIDV